MMLGHHFLSVLEVKLLNTQHSSSLLPSLLSKRLYSYFFNCTKRRKMPVINAWCDKTNFQRATILASVESTNTDKSVRKSQYGNMDGFIY